MSSIISDILLIESMINLAPADSNRVNMMNMYYQDLFVHYNISKEQFQESISYYLSNENDTEKLSDMVKLEMEQLEKEYSDHEPLQKEEEDENRIAPE